MPPLKPILNQIREIEQQAENAGLCEVDVTVQLYFSPLGKLADRAMYFVNVVSN